ncbi:FCD domain-containing protein [Streptomyces sp. NRRL S-813]|uniref:FCD domain-containing protein n=1 Tax=Streptomyces sp. NRRL S-813 TaxID=1463919 RepID=UPI00131E23BA|nr:FCD domain-containing protein [Streptomyces sp. NRRL S-813]
MSGSGGAAETGPKERARPASGRTGHPAGQTPASGRPQPAASPSADLDAARLAAWRAVCGARDASVERISAEMEEASGLPLEWYNILLHLYQFEPSPVSQQDLERHSRLSQSGISRMVTKMQDSGLLQRRPSERDRRNLDVVLTDHGRDIFLRATPEHHAAVQQHFGVWLNDEEAAVISSGLRKVIGAGEEERERGGTDLDQLLAFGESVLSLTSDTVIVADAIRTRDALEPLMLQDAARYITEQGVNEAREIVTRMSRLLESPEEFFCADWDLHRKLAEFSHNEILKTVYLSLLDILNQHMRSVVPTGNLPSYLYERLAIHARIVDAVAGGDEEQVAAAAHAHHFTSARSRLVNSSNHAEG